MNGGHITIWMTLKGMKLSEKCQSQNEYNWCSESVGRVLADFDLSKIIEKNCVSIEHTDTISHCPTCNKVQLFAY